MLSKTPNFDKALNEILENLKPHQRKCQQCGGVFDIFQEDIEFYKKLRVPPPKLCYDHRLQRLMGFANYIKFYKRKCDAPTHKEYIISSFSPRSPYKIYDFNYWWSDNWDPMDYGRKYDFNKSFFEQFQKLNLDIPHTDNKSPFSVNSEYCIGGSRLKNCYYNFGGLEAENLMYCNSSTNSKDCVDCNDASYSELCYETNYSDKCFNCYFSFRCSNCLDSYFLFDCHNCLNCFLCWNLRNKSYYFFNQPLSKNEYKQRIAEINLGTRDILNEYKKRFEEIIKEKAIYRNLWNKSTTNSLGDLLRNCNKCFFVFEGFNLENVRYTYWAGDIKDAMDVHGSAKGERMYEGAQVFPDNADIKFCWLVRNNNFNLEYCKECQHCSHCFGCIGLRNKSYCILNKQYSNEEYYDLVDRIKTKMLKDGGYGEFFPLTISLHPYNDTNATIEFPLAKEEVLKNGWDWYDEPKIPVDLKGLELIEPKDVPRDIKDVSDDILNKAIVCEVTGKPFRIIKPELDFYRKHNSPIPIKHPYQRMLERFQKRNPSKLWKATCKKCQKDMFTSYSPQKQKELKIYCEDCYLREVV